MLFRSESNTNGRIERFMRTVEEGTRTALVHAWLHHSWWPHAGKYWCAARNISCRAKLDEKTPYEKRHGQPFQGAAVPFGAAIYFRPNANLAKRLGKFQPGGPSGTSVGQGTGGIPGLFIGWHLLPGGLWHGDYLVVYMPDIQKSYDAGKSKPGSRRKSNKQLQIKLLST